MCPNSILNRRRERNVRRLAVCFAAALCCVILLWSAVSKNTRPVSRVKQRGKHPLCDPSMATFGDRAHLACIVTGMEHSGTTIVSRMIMAADGLLPAFECGFLMATSPASFQNVSPFYDWLVLPTQAMHWGLSEAQRADVVQSACHAEMYAKLRSHAPASKLHPGSRVVDKTPRYIYNLVNVMDRAPGVPVVVTVKSDDDQISAWARRGMTHHDAKMAVQAATTELYRALNAHPGRVHVVNMTEFAADADATMRRVFDFLGLPWNPEYASLAGFNDKAAKLEWPVATAYSASRVLGHAQNTTSGS